MATDPSAAAESARSLAGLTCPSCGGTVTLAEGWTNARCRYCETPVAVVGERGVARLMVLDRLDRSAASASVRTWLTTGVRKEGALKREASVEEAFLAWFPFARVQCDVVGWVFGENVRKTKRGNSWREERIPVERLVEEAGDLTLPAAEVGEFGVTRVDLRGDELLPHDDERLRARGMVFRPKLAAPELADRAVKELVAAALRRASPDNVIFSWASAIRRRVTLVHYPLWVFRYRFRDRTYQVLVDAEDGSVAYGKAPGSYMWRAFSLVAATAGACFLGTTALQHAGSFLRSEEGLFGLAAVGLGLAALVRWGYRQFRHGGVVEEGTGLDPQRREQPLEASIREMMGRLE